MNNNQKKILITGQTVLRIVSVLAIMVLFAYSLLVFIRGTFTFMNALLLLLALIPLSLCQFVRSK